MFFQSIGGSLGVAAFGALFANRMTSGLGPAASKMHASSSALLDPSTINSLPGPVKHIAFAALAHGIDGVFWAVLPCAIAVFVIALFIKEVPLRGRDATDGESAPAPELDLVA
jgi:hypothetical protein